MKCGTSIASGRSPSGRSESRVSKYALRLSNLTGRTPTQWRGEGTGAVPIETERFR